MKIAYNPKTGAALTTAPANNDITFDLRGLNIFVRGEKFKGTDTTYSVFKKHTSAGSGGYNGLVPVPSYTSTNIRFLREDGTWSIPTSLIYTQLTNQDLDDYLDEGKWYYASEGNSVTNKPSGVNGFELYVGRNAGSFRYQKLITEDNIIWFRQYNSIAWGTWVRWYTDKNTDQKVLQSATTTSNFRPLILGYNHSTDKSVLANDTTNQVYTTTSIYAQPSTGSLWANKFIGKIDWSNIEGKPNSFTPSYHSHSQLQGWKDTRSVATIPNDYDGVFKVQGIKTAGTTLGLTFAQAGDYATIIGWRGWNDPTGGYAWEIASTDRNRLYVRSGGTTTWNNGWSAIAYTTDTYPTSQIDKLTGYTKAISAADLATTDTLNQALGKLEYKTDTTYRWYQSITEDDTDDVINKWHEIVDFIDSVKEGTDITDEFVTRKTAQVITGQKNFNTNTGAAPVIISREGGPYEAVAIKVNDSQALFEYTNDEEQNSYVFKMINTDTEGGDGSEANTSQVIFTGNSSGSSVIADTFIGRLNNTLTFSAGTFAEKTYNNSSAVTVNIPTHTSHLVNNSGFLTQHQSLADYVTLNTAQTITGVKTFSASPILTYNTCIIQNQADTSNYTEVIKWLKGGTSQKTYGPSIGQHNVGGDGTGSICILPYPTERDPWDGFVGLYIRKDHVYIDSKELANTANGSVYFTEFSGGEITSSGNSLTQVNHSITIGGQTRTAGASTCNIINSLSVSTITSSAATNLILGLTVNGVVSTNKTIPDLYAASIRVKDVRGGARQTTYWENCTTNFWFNNLGTPSPSWYSGITIKGWSDYYQTWELASGSDSLLNGNLYYRNGLSGTWQNWQRIMFASELPGLFTDFSNAGSQTTSISIGGTTKTLKIDADMLDGLHSSAFLKHRGTLSPQDNHSADDVPTGMYFAYPKHGVPESWGTLVTFGHQEEPYYNLQLHGTGNNNLYYRTRSSDLGQKPWKRLAVADELKDPASYYWADVPISATSSVATSPTFHSATATQFLSKWFGGVNTTNGGLFGDASMIIGSGYTGAVVYSYGDAPIWFHTGSKLRMLLDKSGNLGIGNDSPVHKLSVAGDIYTTTGFKKNGSSDSYVLLGGGGHKVISDFAPSGHTHQYISTSSFSDTEGTVADYKTRIYSVLSGLTGIGKHIVVPDSIIGNWSNDSASYTPSSVASIISINGGYNGRVYGQFLVSSWGYGLGLLRYNRSFENIQWFIHSGNIGTQSVNYANSAAIATTAQYLASNSRMDYGWNGLNYFNISGPAGTAVKENNTPTTTWWHILRFNHANDRGFYTDLAVPFLDNSLYYKRVTEGVLANGKWVRILDELNYTTYINPDNFVTSLGINKNYVTWTKNGATNNLTVPYASYAGYLQSYDTRGVDNTPGQFSDGARFQFKANSTDGLYDRGGYHGILHFKPYGPASDFSGGQTHQLGFTDGGNLYMRTSTNSTTWGSWRLFVNSENYTGIVLKIGTATKGSATLPIYLNEGTPTACSSTLGVSITGNASTSNTSNRTKFLETFRVNSTTDTYGEQYTIWAQWFNTTNVRLKCTNYTVWVDKADSAGSVVWDNIIGKPDTFPVATHNHDDRYVKLNGTSVMTGDLTLFLRDNDRFIVFSYPGTVNPDSNSWRTGVLGSGNGEANYYVVQYQRINTSSSTWNTAFKIGQNTGTVMFTNNITIGNKVNYHAGNLAPQTLTLSTSPQTYITANGTNYTLKLPNSDPYTSARTPTAHTHPYLPLAGGAMDPGSHVVFPGTSTDASYGGSIEFREVNYVNTTQTDWLYAPGITFHWGGRSVGKLGLRSDGDLAWRDQSIIHSGNISSQSVNYANSAGYTKRLYANSISDLTTHPGDYSLAYSRFQAGVSNIFPTISNANGVITAHLHYGDYFAQIGLSSDGRMYYRTMMNQTLDAGVTWNKVAWTTDIPTKVSQLTNDSGFITGGPYLPLTGGTLSGNLTVGQKDANRIISIAGNTSHLKMVAHTNATYIESGNKDWDGNTPLLITGYSGNKGSNLYLYFDNIYCRSNGNSYVNLDSGNWSSYITIPTATSQLTNDSGFLTSRGYIGRTTVQATAAAQSLTGIGNITPETASTYYLGASDKPWYQIFCRYFTSDLVSLSSSSNSGSLAYSSTSGYFYITANNIAANTSGGFVMKTVKNGVLSQIVLESASNYGQIKTTGDLYIGGRVSNTTALISSDAAHNMYISVQGKALLVCDSSENSIRRGKNQADNITLGTASCPWKSLYVENGVKLKGKTNYFSIQAPNGTHSSDEIFSLPYTGGTLVTTNSPAMVKGWATYSFSYTNGTSSTYTMTFKAGGGVNIVGSPSYYEYYNGPGILIRIDNNCKDTQGTIKDSLMVWGQASDATQSLYITKTTVQVSGSTVHYYLVYCTNTSGTALTSGSGTLNFIYF